MVAGLVGRKADKFAALLDGDAAAAGDPGMSQLADLASRLSNLPQPTAAFRSSLREQLMATAQTAATAAPHAAATGTAAQPTATPAHSPTVPTPRVDPTQTISGAGTSGGTAAGGAATGGTAAGGLSSSITSSVMTLGKSAPLWAKLFAGVAAVSVSATGVAVGADRALPGDFFYGVKKQVEAVQLDLAGGARGKAVAQLDFARARLHELDKLIKREHVVPGKPVAADVAKRLNGLLEAWAEDAGVGTTSLIQQIRGLGSSAANAAESIQLRNELSTFTTQQFQAIGSVLGAMPSPALQSLTVSALGYLQRVDRALGHDPAALIGKLPATLNSIPGVSQVLPRLVLPSGLPTKNGQPLLPGASGAVGAIKSLLPSGAAASNLAPGNLLPGNAVPSNLVPSNAVPSNLVPTGLLPTTIPGISLPSIGPGGISLPSIGGGVQLPGTALVPSQGGTGITLPGAVQSVAGALGNTGSSVVKPVPSAVRSVAGAVSGLVSAAPNAVSSVAGAVKGAVSGVTGPVAAVAGGVISSAGPALPLPTTIPLLPALPKLPGLPKLK